MSDAKVMKAIADLGLAPAENKGACRLAERDAAKGLTMRVVAMLTALRNRATP